MSIIYSMFWFWMVFSSLCFAGQNDGRLLWFSKKSYQEHKNKKQKFEDRQKLFLKNRREELVGLKKEKNENEKAYLLEFYSEFGMKKDSKHQTALSSSSEMAYLKHQKRNQSIERLRKSNFLEYKKDYENYQKKRQKIVASRLKKTQIFRKQKTFHAPIF